MDLPSALETPIEQGLAQVRAEGDRITLYFEGMHQAVVLTADAALTVSAVLRSEAIRATQLAAVEDRARRNMQRFPAATARLARDD